MKNISLCDAPLFGTLCGLFTGCEGEQIAVLSRPSARFARA